MSFLGKSTPIAARLLMLGALMTAGCSDENDDENGATQGALAGESFVLVHGAWNGDWVWESTASRLEAEGAKVRSVNLPAHGTDATPVTEASLSAYVDAVLETIDGDEPVTLLAHSFGGVVVSLTGERAPTRIRRAIYVGAFLPSDGDTALALAQTDTKSDLGPALEFDMERGVVGIRKADFPELFCADCTDRDLKVLGDEYTDEPLVPLTETIELSEARFGSVPKYYVFTAEDRVLSPTFQRRMASGWELSGEATVDTSHCPFFSAPDDLVATVRTLLEGEP